MSLETLGWSAHFQGQVVDAELSATIPARVMRVRRGELVLQGAEIEIPVPSKSVPLEFDDEESRPTLGDWLLLESQSHQPVRRLDRLSLLKRKAPGSGRGVQLIAANVDVIFIVSSCNQEFNLARIERYLVLAAEAGAMPVVVLTKADLCDDPAAYVAEAASLGPDVMVEAIDAREPKSAGGLMAWCGPGRTVALLGSSGTGKSTLANTLRGTDDQRTAEVREVDSRGRHTTTERVLLPLPGAGWLADTPGMRELQLLDVADGLAVAFADVAELAEKCKFRNCSHGEEPGCAVTAAVSNGSLAARRVESFRKLHAEDSRNRETLAQRRGRERSFSKMVRDVDKSHTKRRG
jgi:ribosome biogenesis GTPase